MNKEQLESLVVTPTLKEIPNGYSDKAVLAIMMIVAHESGRGEYLAQLNNGPARGIIQMEGWVHDDVWKNSDSIWANAANVGIISDDDAFKRIHPSSDRLIYDLKYNVFMARQRLFMDVNPLPDDIVEMSKYLKGYWNSSQGSANELSYFNDYTVW